MRRSSTFLAMLLIVWMPIASSWAHVAADQSAPPPPPEAVVASELLTEPPTLHNLGFEWFIQGNSNRWRSVPSFRIMGRDSSKYFGGAPAGFQPDTSAEQSQAELTEFH